MLFFVTIVLLVFRYCIVFHFLLTHILGILSLRGRVEWRWSLLRFRGLMLLMSSFFGERIGFRAFFFRRHSFLLWDAFPCCNHLFGRVFQMFVSHLLFSFSLTPMVYHHVAWFIGNYCELSGCDFALLRFNCGHSLLVPNLNCLSGSSNWLGRQSPIQRRRRYIILSGLYFLVESDQISASIWRRIDRTSVASLLPWICILKSLKYRVPINWPF